MYEPSYQNHGPDYIQVRKDVIDYLCEPRPFLWPYNIDLFDDILCEFIPETRNDFGSLRGYVTSGIMKEIAEEVLKKYNAFVTIENKLIPYIKYKLYNPVDGWIMKKALERFNNNKRTFKNKKSNK
tara:strand:+ start:1350 stop:1727 length:378 start_codon:yes stop_codon:yes gene_type:complete